VDEGCEAYFWHPSSSVIKKLYLSTLIYCCDVLRYNLTFAVGRLDSCLYV